MGNRITIQITNTWITKINIAIVSTIILVTCNNVIAIVNKVPIIMVDQIYKFINIVWEICNNIIVGQSISAIAS